MILHAAQDIKSDLIAVKNTEENTYSEIKKLVPTFDSSNNCIACSNGNYPEPNGAHKCIRCKKPVHALDGCSKQINKDEEGYGERRICCECSSSKSNISPFSSKFKKSLVKNKLETTRLSLLITDDDNEHSTVVFKQLNDDEMIAVENWRGKGEIKSTKKRRTYFSKDPNALYADLNSPTNKKSLGVLQNGSSKKIKCRTINKNKVELLNTCAFDTLVQMFACEK